VNVVSIKENANGNKNRQCYNEGGVITMSITVLKNDIFFIRLKSSDYKKGNYVVVEFS